MSRELDQGEMKSLAHLVTDVFQRAITERATIKDVVTYVRHVRDAFDMELHYPPVSRDPW